VNHQSKTVAVLLLLLTVALSVFATTTSWLLAANFGLTSVISLVCLSIVITACASIMWPQLKGAPWVPTSGKLVRAALSMAELKENEVLYDLGSGDGRVVIAAARDFGARAVGVELDPFRILYSRFRISFLGLGGKARIIREDFFKIDLSNADVVVVYLLQKTNNKLQPKLERELVKPSCRVVSIVWKFDGWELIRADEKEMIYVYIPRSKLVTH
jgi:SAM-dependent methyltransferase